MIIRLVIWAIIWIPTSVLFKPAHGSVIGVIIDAQKHIIDREEALLKQAQGMVRDRIDSTFDRIQTAMTNVAEQVHYYATYPLRAGNHMVGQSMSAVDEARAKVYSYVTALPIFGGGGGGGRTNETVVVPVNGTAESNINGTAMEQQEESFFQRVRGRVSHLTGMRLVVNPEPTSDGTVFQVAIKQQGKG